MSSSAGWGEEFLALGPGPGRDCPSVPGGTRKVGGTGCRAGPEFSPRRERFQGQLAPEPFWAPGISRGGKRDPLPGVTLAWTWGVRSPCSPRGSLPVQRPGPQLQGASTEPCRGVILGWVPLLPAKQRGSFVTVGKSISPRRQAGVGAWSADVTSPALLPSCPPALLPAVPSRPLPILTAPPGRPRSPLAGTWRSPGGPRWQSEPLSGRSHL